MCKNCMLGCDINDDIKLYCSKRMMVVLKTNEKCKKFIETNGEIEAIKKYNHRIKW
jgi:hypothetical protein